MKTDQILQKMQTAQNLRWEDAELAALYPREAKVWTALAEVSRAAGNEARAAEAGFQLGVLGLAPALPGPVWLKA